MFFLFFVLSFKPDFYGILRNKSLNILISDDIDYHVVLKIIQIIASINFSFF